MKNNQTIENSNRAIAAKRVQANHERLSPDQIRYINDLNNYYERKRRYPEKLRKQAEERRKAENCRALILYFSPVVIRILMVVIGLGISVGITEWVDRAIFDYDIIYTLIFCFIAAPMICSTFIAAGEWVIKRIRVNLGYYRF